MIKIIHGDMRQVLKTLPENSISACVVDPPYHLPSAKEMSRNRQDKTIGERLQKGFNGWDNGQIAFESATWTEVLRVLMPGAHIAAFGSTRGYHRLVTALEAANFEIRDTIAWHYSSGYPAGNIKLPNGAGSRLKPAMELICLARKKFSEPTLRQNVERWGTGGINIEASRVGERWPANVLLENDDLGAMSKYFWSSKAAKSEKVGNNPSQKPQKLLQYLVNLICPPLGAVLDPFAGSGSTGLAAVTQGFSTILIEQELSYYNDCVKRLEFWQEFLKHTHLAFV